MSTTTAPASVHATTTGLESFLTRRRSAVEAAASSADQPQQNGQSEPKAATDATQVSPETSNAVLPDKKEKTAEQLKAELSNQAKANLRLGKERADLQRALEAQKKELEDLKAKAAGTFVEPSEDQKQRESALRAEFEKFEQRRESSKELAMKEFGEEFVLANIYQEDSPFTKIQKDQPWVAQRILNAEQPIVEAVHIVNEHEVLTKLGRTVEQVLKKAEEILRPQLFAAFTKELESKETGAPKPKSVPSLSNAKSAGADVRFGGEPVRTFSALNLNPHNRV